MSEIPKKLSKKDLEMAAQLGGEDLEDYQSPDTVPYCDKLNHLLSSLFHQPNHKKHLKRLNDTETKSNDS